MENSGNEAKKYLKTKDITFLSGANYARFACKTAQIARHKDQKLHNFAQPEPQGKGRTSDKKSATLDLDFHALGGARRKESGTSANP